MKLIDIVKKLESQNVQIKYRIRSDGGIVVTEINGTKFQAKKGNVTARSMAGFSLSAKQTAHIEKVRVKTLKPKLSKDIEKQLRKTQRAWRKNQPKVKGKVRTRRVRENIDIFGEEQALAKLKQQERYAKGYAYIDNINALIDRLSSYLPATQNLIDEIRKKQNKFRDEWINDINQLFYMVDQGKLLVVSAVNQSLAIIGVGAETTSEER